MPIARIIKSNVIEYRNIMAQHCVKKVITKGIMIDFETSCPQIFYGRTTKYNAKSIQELLQPKRDVSMVLFPKIVKTAHFRGTFE